MKTRISILALLGALTACTGSDQAAEVNRVEDASAYVVNSFPLDTKEYRYVQLDNGMKVLLISDANAVKSIASLNVNVGSFQDPEGWDGLAHFLEHMLFLGTEKYPDSAEYNEFLDSHGGSHNAYTAYDITNYHFSVDNSAYDGAVDRFAQFFISPLFTEKYVDREKNAVHSEYYTRIERDGIRNIEVFENTINKQHPAFKFNAGTLETLSDKPGRKARAELVDFYKTYYSSDIMALTLVSNQSLETLEKLARAKFEPVPTLENVPEVHFPELFTEGELPKVIEIKPVSESRRLSLTFPIPSQKAFAQQNSVGFVARMLTSESDDSLSDRLKARGWINSIQASAGMNYGGNDSFVLDVSLTKAGMTHQDEIIAALFDQIELVKREGVQEWRYSEIKNLAEMAFRFAENSSINMQGAIGFANALQDTLPRDLLGSGFKKFDSKLINNVLDELRADNMVVSLVAPSVEPELETKFYGADYRTYQPDADRVKSWSDSQYSDLKLAERNPLIPENFDLVDVATAEQPVKLANTDGMEIWHYPNIEDSIPRTTIQLAIDRPERASLEEDLISQVYFSLMGEQLQDLSYNANRAGVSYSVNASGVSFSGYSDKLPELSDKVLAEVLTPRFTKQQYTRLMNNVQRYFRNYDKVQPAQGVGRDLDELLNADSYSVEEMRKTIDGITLEMVLNAPEWLYSEGRMVMMTSGNITEQQSRDFAERIKKTLNLKATDREIPKGQRVVRLNETDKPDVYVSDLVHGDTAISRYYQGRDNTREERITLSLISQIAHQVYFNSLRTEQQLGYIVRVGAKATDRTPGLIFMVQSPTADASTVEAATDKFLPMFKGVLDAMTDDQLAPLKQATIAQLSQQPQNVGEKVGRFWNDIRNDYPNFDSRQQAIGVLNVLTIKDLQDAYNEVVIDKPHAISVISPGTKGGVKATVDSAEAFRKGKEIIVRS